MAKFFDESFVYGRGIAPTVTIRCSPPGTVASTEVFACKYSHQRDSENNNNDDDDDEPKQLACGFGDGSIKLFDVNDGHLISTLQQGNVQSLPTTALVFRPLTAQTQTKNVIVSANANGNIQHWHISSGKCISTITEIENTFGGSNGNNNNNNNSSSRGNQSHHNTTTNLNINANSIYALGYTNSGQQFFTAGKDANIRVYDEARKTIVTTFHGCLSSGGGGGGNSSRINGHSNRIFCVKALPSDDNILISGGWDNTMIFWDLRTGAPVRSVYGPHICGDSIDVCGNEILTGSWRHENSLEIWDVGSGQKISDVPWMSNEDGPSSSSDNSATASTAAAAQCMAYTAKFSRGGKYIVAGGSSVNQAKVFHHQQNNEVIGTVTGLTKAVFTAEFFEKQGTDTTTVVIGGGDSCIRLFDIKDN